MGFFLEKGKNMIGTELPPNLVKLQGEIIEYARGYDLDFFTTIFEIVDFVRMRNPFMHCHNVVHIII